MTDFFFVLLLQVRILLGTHDKHDLGKIFLIWQLALKTKNNPVV